jgi:transcriptional repressor NrdR
MEDCMRCPSCGHPESKVVDSRPSEEYNSIRRRRECLKCGTRFTTYERLGDSPLIVIKADGTSQVFSREKLYRGISIACAKRPNIPNEKKTEIIDSIEAQLRNTGKNEIRSKELGDMVLERLRGLDDVAYIRFASVYKDFQSIEEFEDALKGLE